MTENIHVYLNCLFKDTSGLIRWKRNLKNSDVLNFFQTFYNKTVANKSVYDKQKVVQFLIEVEGTFSKQTLQRKFDDFVLKCKSKAKHDFLDLQFDGISKKIDWYRNRFKDPEYLLQVKEKQIRLKDQLKYFRNTRRVEYMKNYVVI